MGMREYDNGTKIFYEDEYDNHQNNINNSTSSLENIEYNIDLINSLFSSEPDKQQRFSYEHRPHDVNQSSMVQDDNTGQYNQILQGLGESLDAEDIARQLEEGSNESDD